MIIPKPECKQISLSIFEETICIKFSGAMEIAALLKLEGLLRPMTGFHTLQVPTGLVWSI